MDIFSHTEQHHGLPTIQWRWGTSSLWIFLWKRQELRRSSRQSETRHVSSLFHFLLLYYSYDYFNIRLYIYSIPNHVEYHSSVTCIYLNNIRRVEFMLGECTCHHRSPAFAGGYLSGNCESYFSSNGDQIDFCWSDFLCFAFNEHCGQFSKIWSFRKRHCTHSCYIREMWKYQRSYRRFVGNM